MTSLSLSPAFEVSVRQTGAVEKFMPLLVPTMILPAIMTDTLRAAIFMISANVLALWPDRFRAIKAGSPLQTNAPNSFWALSRDVLNGKSQSRFEIYQKPYFLTASCFPLVRLEV